ncbi:MAG: HD-GYP domain-containing protein [Planctomycetota bacterium]
MSHPGLPAEAVRGLLDRATRLALRVVHPTSSAPPAPFDAMRFEAAVNAAHCPSRLLRLGEAGDDWLGLMAPVTDGTRAYVGIRLSDGNPAVGFDRFFALRLIADLCVTIDEHVMHEMWQRNLDSFTRELDQAYENLSLIYRLGRQSTQFEDPITYFETAAEELRQLLDFGWVAVLIDPERKELGDVSGVRRWTPFDGQATSMLDRLDRFLLDLEDDRAGIVPCEERAFGFEVIVQPLRSGGKRVGWLAMGQKAPGADGDAGATSIDTQAAEAVAGAVSNVLDSLRMYHQQEMTFLGTLRALTRSLDAKDRYTRGHSDRVAWLGRELTVAAGFDYAFAERVHLSGVVHDIGKIGLPDAVLRKPGRLTSAEFELVKTHPRIGFEILGDIPAVQDALPGVLHHHERHDGRGYPDGLSGHDIPLMARILSLADAFDAMSSNRAYRPARERDVVLKEIGDCSGTQFDPSLAEVFISMDFSGFDELIERHRAEQIEMQDVDDPPMDRAA